MLDFSLDTNNFGNRFIDALQELCLAPRELLWKQGTSVYENPDPVIRSRGISYIEREVENDLHVISCVGTRINALVKKGWEIKPASTDAQDIEIRDFVLSALKNMKSIFETDIPGMMTMIMRGYSLSEIVYEWITKGKYKGKVGLKAIRFKQQRWLSFKFYDNYGNYIPVQIDPERRELPLDKFIHLIHGYDDENPYGTPLGSSIAFYTWMKKNGYKFWALFMERFSLPLSVVELPPESKKGDEIDKTADKILQGMNNSTGIKIPKGMVVRFLEATRSGDASYNTFTDACNKEISKCILGQTLTIENSKGGGTGALGEVHSDVLSAYTLYDMIITQAAINAQLIRRLVDLNYPNVEKYPEFNWKIMETSLFAVISQALDVLVRNGLEIDSGWVYDILRIPRPETKDNLLKQQPAFNVPNMPGLDNKAKDTSFHFAAETYEADAEDNAVVRAGDGNERIVSKYIDIYAEQYESLSNDIIAKKRFDAEAFPAWAQKRLAPLYLEILILGTLKGRDEIKSYQKQFTPIQSYRRQMDTFALYKPFDKIVADYIARGVISRDEYEKLSEAMKRAAFSVAKTESDTMLASIKDKLAEVLQGNMDADTFEKAVHQVFEAAGVSSLKSWHIETVLRTNLQSSYNEGRAEMMDGLDETEFPAKRIIVIMDSRVRASHAALHGFTRSKNDAMWVILRPPFDYNCRCTIRPIHRSEPYTISDTVPDLSDLAFISR